jgi:crossover junction endodeoxyribonuclease RusA
MIALTLPFPPTVNHMWGQCGTRKYLKTAGKQFRATVSEIVADYGVKLGQQRLAVFASMYAPTRRKYDIDNRIKSLLDALQEAGVFDDDEQVDVLWIIRREVVKGGMCKVVIVEADKAIETYREIQEREAA